MKHKMMGGTFLLTFCAILIFHGKISAAKPLEPEDVESLLPPSPRDKNETIAAVVQDPVVQDAIHQTASNSSLNGLVVKRKVYILPANDPNKILSKSEHILVVPTENLEDVRKNITEAKQVEAESLESSSIDNNNQLLVGGNADDYVVPQSDTTFDYQENQGNLAGQGSLSFTEAMVMEQQIIPVDENHKIESEFLEEKLSQHTPLPEVESKEIAVPIVAVIDPSKADKANNNKVDTPIVAILPNQLTSSSNTVNKQVQFLKDNSDKIQQKTQNYIDQSSMSMMTINPDFWKTSTPSSSSSSSSSQETVPVSLLPEGSTNLASNELYLAPVAVPRWGIVAPLFQDSHEEYPKGPGDMDVAEDIIFRPLFRYRQQLQGRSRYSDRRYSYPRRSYYRSQYDDY
ncbi:uncharacterized protein LOC143212306 isoform X2 [Lasioglossum baleicum]|uniref:uncharacterized protein LOC143212306 isoform X2 n=1 Tax=Lasioglossum baleicum TaxID=434251 RepID=UPI003FCCA739